MPSEKIGTMEYVYAALMLHKIKKEINEANITNIVKASGSEVNDAKVKALVASLAGVNIEEAIKAAPITVAAAPVASAGGEAKKEKKEAETPSAKSEEQAMEGLSSLFG